jgi:DNA-binding FadR family transcriptional regulator
MKVQKFGGAAADSAEAIARLLDIAASSGDDVLVVSAFGGITDQLMLAGSLAERRGDYRRILDEIAAFHRNIAEASKNSVLSAVYGILAMLGQQTELFEYMRKSVGATYRTAHRSILEALRKHDPDEAERCMLAHVDGLMENVRKYWEHYRE